MASNKLHIDIGTSYSGKGVDAAKTGVTSLGKTVEQTSGRVGKLTGGLGKLGGILGEIGGPASKTSQAIQGIFQGLSGGPLGVAIAGVGMLVSAYKTLADRAEKAKEAAIAHRKALREARIAAEIAQEEALERKQNEKNKRLAEELKYKNELVRKNWEIYEAEKKRLSVKDKLTLDRMSRDTASRLEGVTDEGQRKIITAEAAQASTAYSGKTDVRDAKLALKEAQAEFKSILNKINNTDDLKERGRLQKDLQRQGKVVDQRQLELTATQERVAAANEAAARAVKLIKEEILADQFSKAAAKEAEDQAKQREADITAGEAFNSQLLTQQLDELVVQRESQSSSLESIDEQIRKTNRQLDGIKRNQETIDRGINVNNDTSGNGLNGQNRYGQYDWNKNRDANGNLNKAGIDRAMRMAEGGDRNAAARGRGLNNRQQERFAELEGRDFDERFNGGRKLSDRERKELDKFRRWEDQQNGDKAKGLQNQLQNLQQQRDQAVIDMGKTVDEIKVKLDQLGLK